jgi:hypothetical protein
MPKKQDNPDLHVDLMFPSRYLRAADFEGKNVTLTIREVKRDNLRLATGGLAEKYVISFAESEKTLVLNKTNARAIAKVLGEQKATNWAGQKITLKPAKCEAFGEIVDCVRVAV